MSKHYIDFLEAVMKKDIEQLKLKDNEYGGSWKKRGGVGAYMNVCRKVDRIENQLSKPGTSEMGQYDIFSHISNDKRPEGILDDIRDLRRYLLLIEAEMTAQGKIT